MGFESPQPRRKSIDEILAGLKNTPEPNGFEIEVNGVVCKLFATSDCTWNVYQDGALYAVTRQHNGSFVAAMQSDLDFAPNVIAEGKARAVSAVSAHLT